MEREVLEQARDVIKDAREGGFSDLEIRNMFRERGWRDADVDSLINQ